MKTWIFDVDVTLTPSRSKMEPDFEDFFYFWVTNNDTYLCSGSDLDKIKEQLTPRILNSVKGVFTCMANVYHEKGEEVYRNDFTPPEGLEEDLNNILQTSEFKKRTGNHIEKRIGAWNFSEVGRNAIPAEREEYKQWDDIHNSRQRICKLLNNKYGDKIDTSLGGDISIDICNKGGDKRQVVEYLSDLDYENVIFVGDRIHPGGNDYALAVAIEAAGGKYHKVSNWRDTRNFLSEKIIIKNLTT